MFSAPQIKMTFRSGSISIGARSSGTYRKNVIASTNLRTKKNYRTLRQFLNEGKHEEVRIGHDRFHLIEEKRRERTRRRLRLAMLENIEDQLLHQAMRVPIRAKQILHKHDSDIRDTQRVFQDPIPTDHRTIPHSSTPRILRSEIAQQYAHQSFSQNGQRARQFVDWSDLHRNPLQSIHSRSGDRSEGRWR